MQGGARSTPDDERDSVEVFDGFVPAFSEEWGKQVITTMRDYIDVLERSVDDGSEVETLSGQPFCGCTDCYERETYLLLIKLTLQGQKDGLVYLERQ